MASWTISSASSFFILTFTWSKPSPYTPLIFACDTKASSSIALMMRKMCMLS